MFAVHTMIDNNIVESPRNGEAIRDTIGDLEGRTQVRGN
jgi:hypothetical protein